ncbi:carbohydrate ABC transporter permease [Ruminococcaceae bacterium OttesenSCG-928-D13]|nr:carbohydrate ABC transporter permease [Ruminococcaceae bacterium OttesenSCG-928-D13]
MTRRKIGDLLVAAVLWLLTVIVLVPLVIILLNSLKSQGEAVTMQLSLPEALHWENYTQVARQTNILGAFVNSLMVAVSTVAISIFGASMGAFVMSRRRTKGMRAAYFYFLIGLVAPLNMVPAIQVLQKLHLMGTRLGLILLYSALVLPLTMFLYHGFISTVPRELDEAAVIDGCSALRLFFSVVFPLLKPVTVTVGILNFMSAWNDFITPFYIINDSAKMPMTTMIYSVFGTFQRSWNLVCAMMMIIIIPIIVVYLMGQKYIISGMTAGAVKG